MGVWVSSEWRSILHFRQIQVRLQVSVVEIGQRHRQRGHLVTKHRVLAIQKNLVIEIQAIVVDGGQ